MKQDKEIPKKMNNLMVLLTKNQKCLVGIIILQLIIIICLVTAEKWFFISPISFTYKTQDASLNLPANQNSDPVSNFENWDILLSDAISERNKIVRNIKKNRSDDCLGNCGKHGDLIKQKNEYTFLNKDFDIDTRLFESLQQDESHMSTCDGKLNIHFGSFAKMQDAILRPFKWDMTGLSEAGKQLYKFKDHSLRTDEDEILKPKMGLFELYCPNKIIPLTEQASKSVLMLNSLKIRTQTTYLDENIINQPADVRKFDYEQRFTLAIEREEYANMYHMMLHMHNIFSMIMFFHQQPVNLSLLILDSHPEAEIDSTLQTLYGPLVRVTNLRRPVKFENLVLSLRENRSPLSKYFFNTLPHLEEFRTFVYNQHMLDEAMNLDCENLKITFIWRRDKVYHPRNLKGSVERKIFNEAEIYKAVYEKYPSACVNGLLLESLPMKEQLKYIRKTDILIGMHGAGLTHALFLPKTSALIELFPYQWRAIHPYYKLFEAIAKWRNLPYLWWENGDKLFEMPNYFTVVDTKALIKRVDRMIHHICLDHFDLATQDHN